MLTRVLIGLAVLAVVGVVAVVLERRRRADAAPVRDPFPVPRQLTRADFPRPETPWLVALFSSTTCDGCEAMRGRVAALETGEVVVVDVSWQDGRALHERYEISGVPMVLVADADGVVRRAFVGSVTSTDLWAGVAGARDPSLGITHGLDALAYAARRTFEVTLGWSFVGPRLGGGYRIPGVTPQTRTFDGDIKGGSATVVSGRRVTSAERAS